MPRPSRVRVCVCVGGFQGAAGAASCHLPAAEGEPGGVGGGDRRRHGGAAEALLAVKLRPPAPASGSAPGHHGDTAGLVELLCL